MNGPEIAGRYLHLLERASLPVCLLLALASTGIWWLLDYSHAWLDMPNLFERPDVDPDGINRSATHASTIFGEAMRHVAAWSSGAVYSVLVLFRYVRGGRRLAVTAGAGVFSYWLGVQIAFTPIAWVFVNTIVAGAVTAMFLGYVAARLGRLMLTGRLFLSLAGAGALGGGVIGWSTGVPFDSESSVIGYVVGHGLWQVLTCVCLYYAPQDPPGESG